MADDDRWTDRDREWREDRSWQEGRGGRSGGSYGARGGGGRGGERWRQMHADRRHEGPAGYNDSGPAQGGWEFGDREQGGERGQGYEQMGYGRDPGVGSGYGETWNNDREYGRGGGYGAGSQGAQTSQGDWRGADRGSYDSQYGQAGRGAQRSYGGGSGGGYGLSQEGGGYRSGRSSLTQGGYGGQQQYGYGAHTPYGYRGRNEYDTRGRGGQFAEGDPRGQEDRSWLERAGEKVAGFFGAGDEGGQHRGRGPKGYRRSDDRIREDISDRLTDDPWLDASGIDVEVKECEVILKGEVSSREDKRRAEDLAEAISGVRNVQNHLRVGGAESDYDGFGSTKMMGDDDTTRSSQTAARNGTADKDQKGATRLSAPDATPGLNT